MSLAGEATRTRIVDAAEEALVEFGPAKVTLDRVASTAKVHRATIYRHFPGGHDELLVAVVERVAKRFSSRLADHVSALPTLSEAIVEALVFTVEATFRSPTIAPLFASEEAGRTTAAAATSRAMHSIAQEMWGPLLADAQQRGEARTDLQIDDLVELLLRLQFSLLADWSTRSRSREHTKHFLRQVITPFVAGTAPTSIGTTARTPPSVDALVDLTSEESLPVDDRPVAARLLQSAATLFREKGYAQSTTRELAGRLGISQPSLYHHVGTKQDLLEGLCIESLRGLRDEAQAIPPDSPERVRRLIAAHVARLANDRDLHLARVFEQDALDADAHARVVAEHDAYVALVRSVLSAEQTAGHLRADIDAKHLSLALLNLLNWTIFWFNTEGIESADDVAALLADVFLDGAGYAAVRPLGDSDDTLAATASSS